MSRSGGSRFPQRSNTRLNIDPAIHAVRPLISGFLYPVEGVLVADATSRAVSDPPADASLQCCRSRRATRPARPCASGTGYSSRDKEATVTCNTKDRTKKRLSLLGCHHNHTSSGCRVPRALPGGQKHGTPGAMAMLSSSRTSTSSFPDKARVVPAIHRCSP